MYRTFQAFYSRRRQSLDGYPQRLLRLFEGQRKGGYFLSLERSVGESGYSDRIFQVFTGDATDTSRIASLSGELQKVQPMRKKLLLDFDNIRITAGNLEGMSLGPRLPDGSQSLLVVSDDNFNGEVGPRFLLFRLVSS